jgi:single-strand selective monofunctional uracil DNA glycosylase
MVEAARELAGATAGLRFGDPVTHVYHPLEYAWEAHEAYLRAYATSRKRVLFLGMNPGPFGMAQTGVPFGEVASVSGWLGVRARVGKPVREHPKRPVEGFACARSEVSGRRLWGAFRERFERPEAFFADHFVANYCPLLFLEESGRNRTPDALPAAERARLFARCDAHLAAVAAILMPDHVVGIGRFAATRAADTLGPGARVVEIPHPSPANPAANRGWSAAAIRAMEAAGVW